MTVCLMVPYSFCRFPACVQACVEEVSELMEQVAGLKVEAEQCSALRAQVGILCKVQPSSQPLVLPG